MAGKRLIKVHAGLYRTEGGARVMRWTFGPAGRGPWLLTWRTMVGGTEQERSFPSLGAVRAFLNESGRRTA